jgi:hypothetical protein
MLSNIPKYIGQFILLILIQIIILDNVAFNGYINPYLYILFIITLPFETNKLMVLGLAILQGFIIDIFTHTIGMHLSACIFLAYCRPFILRFVSPREGYDFGLTPSIKDMGIIWFLTYSGVLIFLHHSFLFFVEAFRFSEFYSTFLRIILSTFFTLILVIVSQLLNYNKSKR